MLNHERGNSHSAGEAAQATEPAERQPRCKHQAQASESSLAARRSRASGEIQRALSAISTEADALNGKAARAAEPAQCDFRARFKHRQINHLSDYAQARASYVMPALVLKMRLSDQAAGLIELFQAASKSRPVLICS